jgi:hypothetical protein
MIASAHRLAELIAVTAMTRASTVVGGVGRALRSEGSVFQAEPFQCARIPS